jgi:NAD(P)-dependent dehydrogenase (short-subunit alcohol dehydrogenase family)
VTNLSGKIIIITGANSGIGKETARGLAKLGARVVMVCRNPEKAKQSFTELDTEFPGKFDLLFADISSLKSIEKLALEIQAKYPRIDVLLHNAGIFNPKRVESIDGIEATLATNHIGVVHLTELILPLMIKSSPSRIVITSSATHLKARLDINDLECKTGNFLLRDAYGQSKLLNLLYMRELQKRLNGTGVTVNCLHPGVVSTNIGSSGSGGIFFKLVWAIARKTPFFITPEEGAKTSIYLASEPSLEKVTGKYFSRSKPAKFNKLANDPKIIEVAWKATAAILAATR